MTVSGPRVIRLILLALAVLVPLLPNPRIFTNSDSPKWMLLIVGVAAALLIVFRRAVASKESVRVPVPEHLGLLAVLVLMAFFLAKRAPDARATERAWAVIGALAAAGVLAAVYLSDGLWAKRTVMVIAVAGALAAMVGIAGWCGGLLGTASTFGNPSFAAEFVAPAALLTAALLLTGRVALGGSAGAFMLLFLILAKSRADWLGLLTGLGTAGLLILLSRRSFVPPFRLVAGAVLGAALILPWIPELIPLPLFGRSDTVEVRRLIRRSTLKMAAEHPMGGVGLEGFRAEYPAYRPREEIRLSLGREVTFPHNLTLSVAAEAGIPGVVFLLFFLWTTVASGVRTALRRPEDGLAPWLTGAAVAVIVSAQFSAPLRHPASALLFFVVSGLLVSRRPRRYVTDLTGRYRRALPVAVLLVGPVAGLFLMPPDLMADRLFMQAKERELDLQGGMDPEVERLLVESLDYEETVEALHQLAFYRSGTGQPEQALALLDRLFRIAPHDYPGKIERARALLALGKSVEALRLLDELAKKRPDDDVVAGLRPRALLGAVSSAPLEETRRHAREISVRHPELVMALIRAAERIGAKDPERAMAILLEIEGPEAVYYMALLLAAHDKLDEAMDALRSAVRGGAADRERLLNDPRLDPLRKRADFRTLLGPR